MPKIRGNPVFVYEGLEIYISDQPAKREGRDRLWISIRQKEPKAWRVTGNLSYTQAVDVRFERRHKSPIDR
jgi:hypothetical protein